MKNKHVLNNITALDFDLMNSRDLYTNYINLPVCLAGLDSLYMPLAAPAGGSLLMMWPAQSSTQSSATPHTDD